MQQDHAANFRHSKIALTKIDEGNTHFRSASFIPKHFFKELIFRVLMKKKYEKQYAQAWANLNGYCKGLLEKQQTHPYRIVLEKQAVAA